ncbi:hypothetical protein [Sphingobacterium luzhongxinii]|uniref:hypothetical protein n=2 Tax=Sphingobacterium TaxID=28453 RepID=UPI0013DCCF49|nr:hypothetical protein [Sphingobacterium sp. xlx-183]
MVRATNFPNIGKKNAYHIMINTVGIAVLSWDEKDGWEYNIRNDEWFGITEIDILIELLESNSFPWLTPIEKGYLLQ